MTANNLYAAIASASVAVAVAAAVAVGDRTVATFATVAKLSCCHFLFGFLLRFSSKMANGPKEI